MRDALTRICIERTYTVKFPLSCTSSSAKIVQIKRLHNFFYKSITIHILSSYSFFSTQVEKTFTSHQTSGRPYRQHCQQQKHSNQRTFSSQQSYSPSPDTAELEGNAIHVDHAEVVHERPGTFSTILVLHMEMLSYRGFLNMSLAESLSLFELTSGLQAG